MVPKHDSALRDAVIEALGDGALTIAELRTRLGARWDRAAGRDELDRLLQLDTAFTEVGGGFAFTPALLEGTAWTVPVDPDHAAEGFVRMHPHLSPLGWWLIGDDVPLVDVDGKVLGVLETDGWMIDDHDTDVILGPDGWLDGLDGVGWARVEVAGGALRWSPLATPPAPTAAQVAAVKSGFERAVRASEALREFDVLPMPEHLHFTSGAGPVDEALLVDPAAFRSDPIPPLPDLYEAAGLVERRGTIAVAGFDWDALRAWQSKNRLRVTHGLEPAQVEVLAELLETGAGWSVLDDGAVAAAWWAELERRPTPVEESAGVAAEAVARDEPSIGRVWLQARVLDRSGEAVRAVQLLEAAVDGTCRHGPALLDLAGFRADQGDAAGALRLLVQAGVTPYRPELDDDDGSGRERDEGERLWDEVEGFATHRPRPAARRNDPCPCGSGRKYKVCHLGRETHALDDRAGWLYQKAQRFLHTRQPGAVEDLAGLIVDHLEERALFDALVDGPFLPDVVLHEDGVFAEFLAARDALLPDDEALLAAQWALVDRAVFEVLESRGSELYLRDLARGDRVRVVNTHPSQHVRTGMLLVGRPLPVGETHRAFSGFMAVPHGHQDALLAAIDSGDSDEIADAIAALLAPPRLANTDGEDLAAHTVTWRVPEPDAVGDALVGAGLQPDGRGDWTLVRDSKNQNDTLIASVHLDGHELTAEVNSAERAAELLALVATALADAEVLDVEVRPFELPDRAAGSVPARPPEIDDPALRAALAEYVAGYERRWLDESIPALGGRTPREAAADPVGREELIRLLASFPEPSPDDIGMMDPRRLRAELGL